MLGKSDSLQVHTRKHSSHADLLGSGRLDAPHIQSYGRKTQFVVESNAVESLPYAPAASTPMMSTHTMTGAVNLSSNRNSKLTTMAISRPLSEGQKISKELSLYYSNELNVMKRLLQGNSQENPGPRRREILKDPDADLSRIEAIYDVTKERQRRGQAVLMAVRARSKGGCKTSAGKKTCSS